MQPIKTRAITETHIDCPKCGNQHFRIDHLFGKRSTSFGPWNCRSCYASFKGVVNKDHSVEIEFIDTTVKNNAYIPVIVLLKTQHKNDPVYFAIEHWLQEYMVDDFVAGTDQWLPTYFENHACPTNFMRVERICVQGDSDPHGVMIVQDVIKKTTAIEQLRPTVSASVVDGGEHPIDPFEYLELLFPYISAGGRDKHPDYTRWIDPETPGTYADVILGVNADRVDMTVVPAEASEIVVYCPDSYLGDYGENSPEPEDYVEWNPLIIDKDALDVFDDYYIPIQGKSFANIRIIRDKDAFITKTSEKGIVITEKQYSELLNKIDF